jgi:hypothetical protein
MNTDIRALSKIRTNDPSFRACEISSCLRPRGHWYRPPTWHIAYLIKHRDTFTFLPLEAAVEMAHRSYKLIVRGWNFAWFVHANVSNWFSMRAHPNRIPARSLRCLRAAETRHMPWAARMGVWTWNSLRVCASDSREICFPGSVYSRRFPMLTCTQTSSKAGTLSMFSYYFTAFCLTTLPLAHSTCIQHRMIG